MKVVYSIALILFLASCGSEKPKDKKAELEKLKKEPNLGKTQVRWKLKKLQLQR